MNLRPPVTLALACALVVLPASAQNQVLWWNGTWDAALKEARARNVPLLVAFVQDGEEANDRCVTGLFPDTEFVKATTHALPMIASLGDHATRKQELNGQTLSVCARFGAIPCAAHRAIEPRARETLCDGPVQTPQLVVALPDSTVTGRIVDVGASSQYAELVKAAQRKLKGRGLTAAEIANGRRLLKAATEALAKDDFRGALKSAQEALDQVKGSPFARDVEVPIAEVETRAKKAIDAAHQMADGGDALGALRALDAARQTFEGAAALADAKKEETRIKGTKAGSEAARILTREEKGRPALAAAQAAEREKDFVSARRHYLKIQALAPDTPLAKDAAARVAELSKDPDLKALFDRDDREAQASAALKEADKLVRGGDREKARSALKDVVDRFAGTKAAEDAAKRLTDLK